MLARPCHKCRSIQQLTSIESRTNIASQSHRSLSYATQFRRLGRAIPSKIATHHPPIKSGFSKRWSSQFAPLLPPSPISLGKPVQAKNYRRTRRLLRRTLQFSALIALTYTIDTQVYDSCLTRSARTFYAGIVTLIDYNLNFRPDPLWPSFSIFSSPSTSSTKVRNETSSLNDVHKRAATRLFTLLRENGGLYLKIGQAIAMQSAILPPEFQKMFASMFDDAPQNSWEDVRRVIKEDFGKEVEEVFDLRRNGSEGTGVMETFARASASVAQVHWARLSDGREVAIKVQKREIQRQVGWDLWAFKVMTHLQAWWFDIPLYGIVPFVSERLMLETDFENEARNADRMRELVQNESRLSDRVYIPKVYHELCSKRVMTAEWIEGVRLWDKENITDSWRGGWRTGSPGAGGAALPPLPSQSATSLKPDRTSSWKTPSEKSGLGLSLAPIMETMISLFSAQMFIWGVVHADPHPGNIIIRRLPSGKAELVLLDHGLYVTMSPEFRLQYARLWKALLSFDNATISSIVTSWGVTAPDLFASATLMRPYTGGDKTLQSEIKKLSQKERREQAYAVQMRMRKAMKEVLTDEARFPKELLFLGRNLRIVQGNNQFLGSPVNRIKITGLWASRALTEDENLNWGQRWKEYLFGHLVFKTVLLGSDVVWWWSRARQWVGVGKGMDDDIEESMKSVAEGFGVEMQHGVFDG